MARHRELDLPVPEQAGQDSKGRGAAGLEAVVPDAAPREWRLRGPSGSIALRGGRMSIGRGDEGCPVDIALKDGSVSRLHAEVVATPKGWSLRDLDSTNGTSLGARRLLTGTLYALLAGDVITVGEVTLRMELGDPAQR